jgi:hypothetical protein
VALRLREDRDWGPSGHVTGLFTACAPWASLCAVAANSNLVSRSSPKPRSRPPVCRDRARIRARQGAKHRTEHQDNTVNVDAERNSAGGVALHCHVRLQPQAEKPRNTNTALALSATPLFKSGLDEPGEQASRREDVEESVGSAGYGYSAGPPGCTSALERHGGRGERPRWAQS